MRWLCDATATAAFKSWAISPSWGERGVQRHIAIFQAKGIWLQSTPCWRHHTWLHRRRFRWPYWYYESVSGNTVNTQFEGNSAPSAVRRRSYAWNHWHLKVTHVLNSSTSASTTASSGSKSVAEVAQEAFLVKIRTDYLLLVTTTTQYKLKLTPS